MVEALSSDDRLGPFQYEGKTYVRMKLNGQFVTVGPSLLKWLARCGSHPGGVSWYRASKQLLDLQKLGLVEFIEDEAMWDMRVCPTAAGFAVLFSIQEKAV